MKSKTMKIFSILMLFTITACSQKKQKVDIKKSDIVVKPYQVEKVPTHRYGGWYCPDNLNGFPAVNLAEWKSVPVINGRLPTEEEAKSSSSLILVDTEKYPNAKPLDIPMPQLATFTSPYTNREEVIIVIQALNIDNDSIVGFRYLNGGNGSANLREINIVPEANELNETAGKFVSFSLPINSSPSNVWTILTEKSNSLILQPQFDKENNLKSDWRQSTNVNYHYHSAGDLTSDFGDVLYGNFYIQNDYDRNSFTEKFMILENEEKTASELKIVCGPFNEDFEEQKQNLTNWAKEVKSLSESGGYFNRN